jgi:hypothetical protein
VAESDSSLPTPRFVPSDIFWLLSSSETSVQYPWQKLTVLLRPRTDQRALAQLSECMGLLLQAVRADHLRLAWCDVAQVTAVRSPRPSLAGFPAALRRQAQCHNQHDQMQKLSEAALTPQHGRHEPRHDTTRDGRQHVWSAVIRDIRHQEGRCGGSLTAMSRPCHPSRPGACPPRARSQGRQGLTAVTHVPYSPISPGPHSRTSAS